MYSKELEFIWRANTKKDITPISRFLQVYTEDNKRILAHCIKRLIYRFYKFNFTNSVNHNGIISSKTLNCFRIISILEVTLINTNVIKRYASANPIAQVSEKVYKLLKLAYHYRFAQFTCNFHSWATDSKSSLE